MATPMKPITDVAMLGQLQNRNVHRLGEAEVARRFWFGTDYEILCLRGIGRKMLGRIHELRRLGEVPEEFPRYLWPTGDTGLEARRREAEQLIQRAAAILGTPRDGEDDQGQPWPAERCKGPRCRGRRNMFSWSVPDPIWAEVVGPDGPNILCLTCFDEMAQAKGLVYANHLTIHGVVTWSDND